MKKQFFSLVVFLSVTSSIIAQGHQAVFPALQGQQLFEAVVADFTPVISLTYGQARDILFGEVYRQNDSLHCIYTNWPIYMPPGADPTEVVYQGGQGINTEHTWPQSLGAEFGAPKSDMHHLYPSRADVNQVRGHLPFSEINDNATDRWYYLSSSTTSIPSNRDNYSELLENSSFEPREVAKGNIARAIFYFYTIYRTQANAHGGNFFSSQQQTLCNWHEQDPVDQKEWERTFLIAEHQSDKANPFVLDCTLAARMYCPDLVGNMCITTATDDWAQELEVKAFPNPSKGLTTVSGFAQEGGRLELNYYDSQGRKVQTESLNVQQGAFELSVQLPYAGYWQCQMKLTTAQDVYLKSLPVVVLP